jgi:hypothetical protein
LALCWSFMRLPQLMLTPFFISFSSGHSRFSSCLSRFSSRSSRSSS